MANSTEKCITVQRPDKVHHQIYLCSMIKMSSVLPVATKNQYLKVTLVRHGETTLNAQRLLQGQTEAPLSERGRAQAEELGKHESKTVFTRAFSSDLSRASDTAQLILQYSKQRVEVKVDKRIRERCFGVFEGKHVSELLNEANATGENLVDYTPQGGETSKQVSLRAGSFFKELTELTDSLENLENEHALVVSHGGWMSNLMRYLNANREHFMLKNFEEAKAYKIPHNTGVTRFNIHKQGDGLPGSKHRIIAFSCFNDSSHLDEFEN